MSFIIAGTGSCVPENVVTNGDLSKMVDTSDEWIFQRVGIRRRHICTVEKTHELAYNAARKALESANAVPEQIDMIICATVGGEDAVPSVACMVQKMFGLSCPAMDINAACSGFIYLLDTAAGFFARGRVKKMLVIGVERLSRATDWTDRSTCVIFADGAGAAVLEPGDNYLASKLCARGNEDVIRIPNRMGKSPFSKHEQIHPFIHMKGQETFKFAVTSMCADLKGVIAQAGFSQAEVDHVIPHQANIRIIEAAKKRLDIPDDRYHTNIDRYGNTSAASVPLVLDEVNRAGLIKRGQIVAFCAFGGGLTSGASVMRW